MQFNAHGAPIPSLDFSGERRCAAHGFAGFDQPPYDLCSLLAREIDPVSADTPRRVGAAAGGGCGASRNGPIDTDRLRRAVTLLVENAAAAGPAPLQLHTRICAAGLEIRIPRAGAGVRPSIAADPGGASGLRKAEELLVAACRLVESQGGRLALRTAPRNPPTVLIRLPYGRIGNPSTSYRASAGWVGERPVARSRLDGAHVVLVEDDPDALDFLTLILQQSGAQVSAFAMAEPALQCHMSAGCAADVIVSDIAMPGQDGYTLLRRLRSLEREQERVPVPAIAVSAFARAEDLERSVASGFDQHLAKPVDTGRLIEEIALWVA